MSGIRQALQDQIDYWDGFNLGIEWFVSFDGKSAVAILPTPNGMAVMIVDDDGSTNSAEGVEFSTGGFEV